MKRLLALALAAIVLIAGHAWRTDDEGEAQRGIITIDDEVTDEFKESIKREVVDEFNKEVDKEVAAFEEGHEEGAGSSNGSSKKNWTVIPGGAWEPTVAHLIELRTGLHAQLRKSADAQKKELMDWSDYRYQYQGQEKDGRRYVFVGASCMPPEPPKPKGKGITIIIESDEEGGACHFQLKYDPEKSEFFDVSFGPAIPPPPALPVPPAPPAPPEPPAPPK